jgi:hypothetical protein
MTAACHDGSPFLTVCCSCSYAMHLHESQLDAVPATVVELVMPCHACGKLLTPRLADLRAAFAGMRADGWIA